MPGQAVPTPPPVAWGKTSIIGLALSLGPILGGVAQAIAGRDAPGLAVAGGGLLVLLATLGGRYAQAVALARSAAQVAGPWIDALQAALAATPGPPRTEVDVVDERPPGRA